jgi:hypothetical protein
MHRLILVVQHLWARILGVTLAPLEDALSVMHSKLLAVPSGMHSRHLSVHSSLLAVSLQGSVH